MKRIILSSALLVISVGFSFGQTNTFPSSGSVGIGTLSPGEKLSVGYGVNSDIAIGSATNNKVFLSSFNNGAGFSINRKGSNGAFANSSLTTASVTLSSDNNNSYIRFNTSNVNNSLDIERVRIDKDGNVGINTYAPQAKLDINGTTYSRKLYVGTPDANTVTNMGANLLAVNGTAVFVKAKVAMYGNTWPDYVFTPTYNLPKLDSLEQFIKLNGHLPEVPKAEEVEKNGIDLGSNQALLLKKIEELTLIVIEQNKRIEKLEKEAKNNKPCIEAK